MPIPARPNNQPIPSAAWVTLTSANPSLIVSALLDGSSPVITSGYGGWVEIARPKRKALIDWQGTSPLKLSFGMILDAFDSAPLDIEEDCRTLERMAMVGKNHQRPPTIQVSDGGKLPHNDLTWVIDSLTWGDQIRQSETGDRLRAVVTIVLVEYVLDAAIGELSPANIHKNTSTIRGGQAKSIQIIVREHDTLRMLAAKFLGHESEWRALAHANNIRDPKKIKNYVGRQLKWPTDADYKKTGTKNK